MTDKELQEMRALDEAIERAGGFVADPQKEIHFDYHRLSKYCKERKIEPIDLTIRELNTFILP